MKKTYIKYDNKDLYLLVSNYTCNGRLYVGLEDENKNRYADITINLPEIPLVGPTIVFLNADLSDTLKNELKQKGLIESSTERIRYNYGTYDIADVNLEHLKEYDEKGYNEYKMYKEEFNNEKEINSSFER